MKCIVKKFGLLHPLLPRGPTLTYEFTCGYTSGTAIIHKGNANSSDYGRSYHSDIAQLTHTMDAESFQKC